MGARQSYRFPFAAYPAVRLGLLFIAGITCQYHLQWDRVNLLYILLILIPLFFVADRISRSSLYGYSYHLSIILYLCSVITFGAYWQARHDYREVPDELSYFTEAEWESFRFSGITEQVYPARDGGSTLELSIDTVVIKDSLLYRKPFLIRAYADDPPDRFKGGDRVRFAGTVYPMDEKRNPHEFDYKSYLALKGIYVHAGIDSVESVVTPTSKLSWTAVRRSVLRRIELNFDSDSRDLAKAVLVGHKNDLPDDLKTAFSRAGLSHIMAVSGLHVGFIIAPFWFVIPFFWTYRYGKQVGLLLLILLLTGYAGTTGFSPSVTRASLTGGFICYGRLFHKMRTTINLTAASALIILLANPNELFKIGFQLSFWAVYVILLSMPAINRLLPDRIRFRWYGTPIKIFIVSAVVQVGLFPLLGYYFGEFSLIGPLANAFIVPVLGFAVPLSLLLLLVSYPAPAIASVLNTPNRWLLEVLKQVVDWTAGFEWSWINVHIDSPFIFISWILVLLLVASLHLPRLRWKLLILFLIVQLGRSALAVVHKWKPPVLQVTIFDVGQGDAALVQTPGRKNMLIDAGRWTPGYNSGESVILPHLQQEQIDTLHALFLSHPHADHIGGVPSLINNIPIDTIYNSGYPYDSGLYRRYLDEADRSGIPVVALNSGQAVDIDPSVRIFVYGPRDGPAGSDPNEHSLVIELIHGQNQFLFTGDAGKQQEQRLSADYAPLLDTDFLKVGHHGSRTGSSEPFLDIVTPDIAVVSLGRRNRFGHPHPEAVRRLKRTEAKLYFTSLDRALIFRSDGKKIERLIWR